MPLNRKRFTSLRFRCRFGPNTYNDITLYITKPLKIDVFPQPGFEVWNIMMASSKSLLRFHWCASAVRVTVCKPQHFNERSVERLGQYFSRITTPAYSIMTHRYRLMLRYAIDFAPVFPWKLAVILIIAESSQPNIVIWSFLHSYATATRQHPGHKRESESLV